MAARTQLFQQLPWIGGVNTSQDDSLIPPNQLVRADNCIFDTKGTRRKRDGIKYNWDNVADANESIRGLHEFYFGEQSKARRLISVSSDRVIRSYTSGGVATVLSDTGQPWTGTIGQAAFQTFNNRAIMAVDGPSNLMKVWDGTTGGVEDLRTAYDHNLAANGRSSVGTTRTLVLSGPFSGVVGDYVVVSNASFSTASQYNGTYAVTAVSNTNVPNDTITYTASTSLTEGAQSDPALVVDGAAPLGSVVREHIGRLWCNDKSSRDRVHFSGSFNHLQWLGLGDSGALDIGVGDGDPEGIVAIFPTFKGVLFVAKRTKLYKISGSSPESFVVELVSSGIGCSSHNSVAQVDQDDMFFVSDKGIHSIAATSNFGDFNSTYISSDIQRTFNEQFSKQNLQYCWGAYLSTINSVAFTFTDTNLPQAVNTNLAVNNAVWLYNIPFKAWYRWFDVPCQSMIVAGDGDRRRFYFGTHRNHVIKSFIGNSYDTLANGVDTSIKYTVTSGQINVDGSLFTVKGFKRFILYYKPDGSSDVNVSVQVDNFPLDSVNTLVFNEQPSATLLGVTFVLGQSLLGDDTRLSSYTKHIEGFGRSFRVIIEQDSINSQLDVQGFAIEYESAGTSPEVPQTET